MERETKHRKKEGLSANWWLLLMAVLAAILFLVGLRLLTQKRSEQLIGTWIYDSHTEYFFDGAGGGSLIADDAHFDYEYEVHGRKVLLEFVDDRVQAALYRFHVEGDLLTLEGGEGTTGGTYELLRVPEE